MDFRHFFEKLDQLKWYDWVFGWFVFLWVIYGISYIVGYWVFPFIWAPLIMYIVGYSFYVSFISIPVYIIWKYKKRKKEKEKVSMSQS